MVKYLITAAIWVGLSFPIYFKLGGVAVCIYGVVSITSLLAWAITRKR
jgi:hypothetical protein